MSVAENQRMTKGLELSEQNGIVEAEDGGFHVPSQTTQGVVYEVRVIESRWVCSCPDFENREIAACKHIYAVKFWIATNTYLQDKPTPKVFADDAMPCERCGSIRVLKYGKDGAKQVFKCKDCGRKFRAPSLLRKARYSPELITLTLDLYFKGVSLRKISDHLAQQGLEINYSTIYAWLRKYIPAIAEYVNTLAPQLSPTWQADELFVPLKNGDAIKSGAKVGYLWSVMDRETRFLLASKLADKRGMPEAVQALKEAVRNAHGRRPQTIHTDMWRPYIKAVESLDSTINHQRVGIRSRDATNNRMERLNGTLRERVKVQRGWKTLATPLADGQRIHYNFVKPHAALAGQTPAQRAGIAVVSGANRWLDLLRQALTTRTSTPEHNTP